ncbi:MAG: Smr/MutS family protein [Desulfobulbaceae bacterium]|uniref:Smr/MutS family protein n=1 Tax=Candidatus Desulfobia pelagia TaxID=2841692 RepID=A0A8J6TCK0_9BACT|nr:Smr/MutS family protein [Candidatus Desulfobia pelagia]
MKSKTKKEGKPFWLEDDDESSFVEIFDEKIFDRDYQERVSRERDRGDNPQVRSMREDPPAPQKEIDLHGFTGPEAEIRVESFIQSALHERLIMLRIITGKGLHSPGAPVLPDIVEQKLSDLKEKKRIKDFHWEKKQKSVSGALLVFL